LIDLLRCSHGELVPHGLAFLNRLEVVVKEVNVETGLNDGCDRLRPAEEVLHLITVHPVENVEEAVKTKGSDVVTGEVLDDAHLVQHDDLGDEGDRFKPDAEGPGESPWSPSSVEDAGQDGGHGE